MYVRKMETGQLLLGAMTTSSEVMSRNLKGPIIITSVLVASQLFLLLA